MKHIAMIAISGVLTFPLVACNESNYNDAQDVRASHGAIAKDQAAINKYQDQLARDRAAKAAAKAEGDPVKQAGKSIEIGTDKAILDMKKTEKKTDERILEEDEEDYLN